MANVWINGKLRRILVGYDGSAECERALEAAIALGDGSESRLLVLAVARPPEPELSSRTNALDTAREHLERTLTGLRSRVRGEGIEIETQVTQGHPAEEIIRKAARIEWTSLWSDTWVCRGAKREPWDRSRNTCSVTLRARSW
jgi:nucleotide-binding universal stress UspA family protein